jgi:signal transduction histidine kinase
VINNNYQVQTNIRTGDEIEHLSVAFDKMVDTISRNEENLKQRLKEAVAKYVALYEEIKEKNESLQTLSDLKSDIIDTMAHDLRTPMTKILSYSEMIKDPKFKSRPETIEKAIEVIYNNIYLLKKSLDQILILSKLEHTEIPLSISTVNLHQKILEALNLFEKEIFEKNLTVALNVDEDIVINTDEEILSHIFKNIISNAIKYNKNCGEISITLLINPEELILNFYDSGLGINENEIDKIQNRFFRGSNVKNSHQGTGLGMSIVYKSVQKLGWDISIESKESVYTRISLSIPIKYISQTI